MGMGVGEIGYNDDNCYGHSQSRPGKIPPGRGRSLLLTSGIGFSVAEYIKLFYREHART